MKSKTISWFIIGFGIGYFTFRTENDTDGIGTSIKARSIAEKIPKNVVQPVEIAVDDVKKLRILCFLNTMPRAHSTRAVHIVETWGKHCDKLLFASTITDVNLGAIGFNVTDDHQHMWGKVKLMLQHIYKVHLDEYDWFIKGDDDMFLITENLRYMLSAYTPDDPIYFGYKFNTTEHKLGYFSGGAGYVMSRKTVRIFVEKILTNEEFFSNPKEPLGCHIETDERVEDWDISVCLDHYNVLAGDSRDLMKRERFLTFWPEAHLFGHPDSTFWYWQRKYYWTDEGLDCCSNYTISSHYIGAQYQYTMYYLTYKLQPFGIERRFPPPPAKNDFSDVAELLERERFEPSLRGF